MNIIFFAIVLVSFVVAGWRQLGWTPPANADDAQSPMEALGLGMIHSADDAVTLALGLIGVMALFLGLMKVAEQGGLLRVIAKVLRPVLVRLFPEVPADHPAMGAIVMNLSANALGLGNAATPFGIRAMQELDELNPHKGTATNAMALFLAINTSSITLLPTGVIALRAAAGSNDPAGIVPTTLVATLCSTTVAIIACKLLQGFFTSPPATSASAVSLPDDSLATQNALPGRSSGHTGDTLEAPLPTASDEAYPAWVSCVVLVGLVGLIPLTVAWGKTIAPWIVPGLMLVLLGYGAFNRVRVYEAFVEGAREGFNVAVRIIPYLVAILVAVGMFRASGAMALLIEPLGSVTAAVGLPADALPMALLRPLSGSGAYGILASIIQDPAVGPDSYTGYLVSTMQGSTETTFYVLAVYFGAVGIRRVRHTLPCALLADAAGIAAAVAICLVLYGGVN